LINEEKAAIVIQKWIRLKLYRKRWFSYFRRRREAAAIIKRYYRYYRRYNVIPILMKLRKDSSALTIQKVLLGYIVRKKVQNDQIERTFEVSFKYFEKLKKELQERSACKIQMTYMNYLQKKYAKQQENLK